MIKLGNYHEKLCNIAEIVPPNRGVAENTDEERAEMEKK